MTEQDHSLGHKYVESLVNQCAILNKCLDEIEIEMASLPLKDLADEFTGLINSKLPLSSSLSSFPSQERMGNNAENIRKESITSEGFATPISKKSVAGTGVMTTPNNKSNQINFDAYPNTPTIEQLGLSGAALELVRDSTNVKKENNYKYSGSSDNEIATIMRSSVHTSSSSATMASKIDYLIYS